MKKILSIAVLSAIALCSQAQASELNYNNAHIAYGANVESTSDDGFQIDGSFKFNDKTYGIIEHRWTDYGIYHSKTTAAGIGIIKPVSDKTDWINEVSYVYAWEQVDGFGSVDAGGYKIATGLRGMTAENFEMVGKINYTDFGLLGSGFGASVGAVYYVNESFGITADYEYHPDNEIGIWGIGARFSF